MAVSLPALRVCADPRCRRAVAPEDEICYECGGTDFREIEAGQAVLLCAVHDRELAFVLEPGRDHVIGRSEDGAGGPDVDLRRFPASDSVHHRHAAIAAADGGWRVTHLGRNALVVRRGEEALPVEPGSSAALLSGDTLLVGLVALRFAAA